MISERSRDFQFAKVIRQGLLTKGYSVDLQARHSWLAVAPRAEIHVGGGGEPRLPPLIADPHQISDQTQTNWNGVIGKIDLLAIDAVWIEDVQVYPVYSKRKIRVRLQVPTRAASRPMEP